LESRNSSQAVNYEWDIIDIMAASSAIANRQIVRAAGTVMAAFVLSNGVGLARQILVTKVFGTQAEFDAFNAANRVAESLFLLVAGGALSSAFIPTFTGLLTKGERKAAWELASAINNLARLILTLGSAVAAIFAPQIVRYILAPGFAENPAQEALTIQLLRLMLPSAVIFGLSGLVMGILNSHQVFFIPALTPAMYQIGMIFGVLVLSPKMGIFGLAWGVVIGAVMHLLLQAPALVKLHGQYIPTLGLKLSAVREVVTLMGPRLLGVAVVQLNFWINARLASHMPVGSYTGVVLAFTLMLMPQAAIAQSVAIAAMPTFSAQFALGKLDELRTSLAASLRGTLLLAIPACLGLMLLRKPIIEFLYQRGEFDVHSTELVAWALLWYAAGLIGHAIVEILSRAFYAVHDTRTPVLVGIVVMSLNVAFSILFAGAFGRWGWMPHGGLALANSLATALEAGGLIYLMSRRLNGMRGKYIFQGAVQASIAALAMTLVLWGWLGITSTCPTWFVVILGVVIGGLVFLFMGWIFGVSEIRYGIKTGAEKLMHFRQSS
jgi:putative peptidoglycan lipid II flippase